MFSLFHEITQVKAYKLYCFKELFVLVSELCTAVSSYKANVHSHVLNKWRMY